MLKPNMTQAFPQLFTNMIKDNLCMSIISIFNVLTAVLLSVE